MARELSPEEKVALIESQLQEVLRGDTLRDIVIKQNRPLSIYWGTATTGRPHCGYLVPAVKIAHFLRAGCRVKILLADVHGFLDNLKAPWELVVFRSQYYKFCITALLRALNIPLEKLEFVLGSSFQYSENYQRDLLRLSAIVTEHDAKKAGAEVVKQVESPLLSGLIYPLMQTLDEQHLEVDAQFGGMDQRKIFVFAADQLPRLGYKERIHLMNPIVGSLAGVGSKMSSSDPDSKIDLLDTPDDVKKKIKKAFATPKTVEGNGLIPFVKFVLLPVSALKKDSDQGDFVITRREGEPLVYHDVESLAKAYEADIVTPQLLKAAVTDGINSILTPIQAEFQSSQEWQDISSKAYPPPPAPPKKEKKVKSRGTRFPGAQASEEVGVVAQPDGHVEGPRKAEVDIGSKGAQENMQKLDIKEA